MTQCGDDRRRDSNCCQAYITAAVALLSNPIKYTYYFCYHRALEKNKMILPVGGQLLAITYLWMHGLLKLADIGEGTLQCKVNTTDLHKWIPLSTDTPRFERCPVKNQVLRESALYNNVRFGLCKQWVTVSVHGRWIHTLNSMFLVNYIDFDSEKDTTPM